MPVAVVSGSFILQVRTHIPQQDGPVKTSAGEKFAIWRKGERLNVGRMPPKGRYILTTRNLP